MQSLKLTHIAVNAHPIPGVPVHVDLQCAGPLQAGWEGPWWQNESGALSPCLPRRGRDRHPQLLLPLQTPYLLLPSKKTEMLSRILSPSPNNSCYHVSECGQEGFPGHLGFNPFSLVSVIRETYEWYRHRNLT